MGTYGFQAECGKELNFHCWMWKGQAFLTAERMKEMAMRLWAWREA